jgi:putative glutamine amidotransferase
MKAVRPRIAVTSESPSRLPGHGSLYLEAVEKAGGAGTFVFSDANVRDLAVKYDGVLIPGGKDIDPAYYGEKRAFPCTPESVARTDFEIALLREIMNVRKAVLGVCYGMQLINVYCKGTLYQDVESQRPGALNHRQGDHLITITGNPFLAEGQAETNTSHHQALKAPGIGIRAFAYAPDGLVEAFYIEHYPFAVGLQWHPERMSTPLSDMVFNKFVGVCREGK